MWGERFFATGLRNAGGNTKSLGKVGSLSETCLKGVRDGILATTFVRFGRACLGGNW